MLRSYVVLVYLFFYLPVSIIILYSFNRSDIVLIWHGFSTRWYGQAFSDPGFRDGIRNSLEVALASATISVVLGSLLAIGLASAAGWMQAVISVVMLMTLTIPEVLVGLSALLFFTSLGVALGLQTIIVTHAVFGISVVALLVRARLVSLGNSLEEASSDLGASPIRTLTHIIIPLLSPAILAGGLLAFTFSFDNFVIAFFTSGPGAQTLPIRIWGQIRFGVSPIANAIGSVIVLFGVMVALIAVRIFRWRARALDKGLEFLETR